MRSLSASDLLSIWEQGRDQTPAVRGLMLLVAFCPEKMPGDLSRLPIGRRDALLMDLREEIFGPNLTGLAICPQCDQRLETSFRIEDIQAIQRPEIEDEFSAKIDEFELRLRLPSSLDLVAVSEQDPTEATRSLIRRCLLGITHKGKEISHEMLPEAVFEEASNKIAESDPQADVELALSCPECGHTWHISFDILSFLWKEIDSWAFRTLQDVHSLASKYGWSEAEILAMSTQKRRVYLELVGR